MKRAWLSLLLVFISFIGLLVESQPAIVTAAITSASPILGAASTSSNLYWFQVGVSASDLQGNAWHEFGVAVTGARVTICTASDMKLTDSDASLSYWIGLDLPNDAFVQTGFLIDSDRGQPTSFWEYFPPGTADEASVGFLGRIGSAIKGCHMFSLTSSGTTWYAYVDSQRIGSVDLHRSDSGGYGPFAVAEVAGTKRLDNVLGRVEFRSLAYRDKDLVWHDAEAGMKFSGYGAGSARVVSSLYPPYSVQGFVGEDNHWLAGNNPNWKYQYVWPWHHVTVTSPVGSAEGSGWYVHGYSLTPTALETQQISPVERLHLAGWSVNAHAASSGPFIVNSDLDIEAVYQTQFLIETGTPAGSVTISSRYQQPQSSGWYAEGESITVNVEPTSIAWNGWLGQFGLESRFTGWTGNLTDSSPTVTVTVQKSMTINANWGASVRLTRLNAASIVIVGLIAFANILIKTRKRGK